jgi:hypothetical protein
MLEKAVAALLETPGHTALSVRRAVFERLRRGAGPVPEDMEALAEKIAARPWSVADADITRLRDAGYSEDQIYGLLLAAATGAGMRRFDAGLRAMEEAG